MTPPVDLASLVAVPLVGSLLPLAVARFDDRAARVSSLSVLVVHAALVAVVGRTALAGRVETAVGGIPTPFAIVLAVDPLSVPFLVVTSLTGLAVVGYAGWAGPRSGWFHCLWLLFVAGVSGVCVTADLFNLYVFLEIGGLAAYALVATGTGGRAALAALNYLLVGTVGATFYLLGVGYVYVATGTLSVAALAPALSANAGLDGTLPVTAFALMLVGLLVKVAVFPLHVWKPPAYATAPVAVTAGLATLVSTVAAYAIVRVTLSAFTVAFLRAVPVVETGLVGLGVGSVAAGSLLAFREQNLRRLLAYSSVSQFGIVTVGVAVATPAGVVGVVVHLVGHALTKGGFYFAVGVAERGYGVRTVDDYAGFGGRAPAASVAVAVFALGLIGIPPTVGFAGKAYVLLATVEAGAPVAGAVVLLSTLASLAYFGRLLQHTFAESPPTTVADDRVDETTGGGSGPTTDGGDERPVPSTVIALVCLLALATVLLGLAAGELAALVEPTVRRLVS